MRGAWSVGQIRAAEQAAMAHLAVPDALMQRAAAGLAAQCVRMLDRVYGSSVVVLAGGGNNGGDALFAAARLARRGARVTVVQVASSVHEQGWAALRRQGCALVVARDEVTVARSATDLRRAVAGADLILDAIMGIGGHGALRPYLAPVLGVVAAADAPVVAVDVPSGVDSDTGWAQRSAAVRADVTVTFGGLKVGLLAGVGAQLAGVVRLVDIGLEPYLPEPEVRVLEEDDLSGWLPAPQAGDDKYTRGVAGVVAGSPLYGGAAVLATGGAIYGGAGMVRYAGPAARAVRVAWPEVVTAPEGTAPVDAGRVQAWLFGPGSGTDDAAFSVLSQLIRTDLPLIVDADGITVLARSPAVVRGRPAPTVLTPHDREFERLFGAVGSDRIGAARRAAADLRVVVLLKGDRTVVASPDGSVYVNPTGTPWLATAGSGDVLSGLIVSLLARGLPALEAAAIGAYVHGRAGQLAAQDGPPSSADVLRALRAAQR